MKKLKYLLFLSIIFFGFNVFADTTYDMTSKITSPVNFPECGVGSYTGVELNGATNCWNTNTRNYGALSRIYFNLPAPIGTTFESDTVYRLSLYMATNDWRNHFGTVAVRPGSDYTNNFVDSFTFVSRKQVNITFTVPYSGSTTYQTLWVNLPATNTNSLITGDTNWNLSKVTLTKLTSGSSGGSTTPSGPSTSFDDTAIINNNNENTQDIINNNNTNTQDIINNANGNTQQITDTIKDTMSNCITNIFNASSYRPGSTVSNISISNNNLSFSASESWSTISYIFNVDNNEEYTLHYASPDSSAVLYYSLDNSTWTYINKDVYSHFIPSGSSIYIRLQNSGGTGTFHFNELMLVKGNVSSFYKLGETCKSKIDETTSAVNNSTNTIINNQNSNTQQTIESQQVCKTIDKGSISTDNYYLNYSGGTVSSSNYGITDYIKINSSTSIVPLTKLNWLSYYCFYDSSKSIISCSEINNLTLNEPLTIPNGAVYFRSSIYKPSNQPNFKICNNGNQAITDVLTDNSDPTIDNSALNDVFGRVHFSDPLSYLLTLPTQLINKIVSMSDTCSPIDLGTLYGVHLTLPCINLENYLGTDLWTILDVILSVGLLSVILKNFYDTISNLLTLGGEKEAKEKFSMPTPMDFLAMILGGDNR